MAVQSGTAARMRAPAYCCPDLTVSTKENIMPTYSLEMSFTQADLDRFYATGTNIVIAKPNDGGQPNVAWVVYRPQIGNTVTWEENYGIYISNTDIVNGTRLTQWSTTPYPAVAAKLYTLSPAGGIVGPSAGGSPGSYTLDNEYNNLPKGDWTVGLFQDAVVNGETLKGNAVSAAPVLYQSTATMTPYTTVYLWTQSQVISSTVVTSVTSAMTKVEFGGSVTMMSLQYDSSTGTFIPAPQAREALAGGVRLAQLLPRLS
jgi:hypothetical protein